VRGGCGEEVGKNALSVLGVGYRALFTRAFFSPPCHPGSQGIKRGVPELPEVETLRRSLVDLKGKTIRSVYLSRLAPVETTTPTAIRRALSGGTLGEVQRWGKYLIFPIRERPSLVLHLGMSGRLRLFRPPIPPQSKHTHLEIGFSDGSLLRFVDSRRFGTLSLSFRHNGQDNEFLKRLGPDYLDPKLSPEVFLRQCRRHPKISLKSLTLHQGIATGLGNIYACEALYRAQLDPRRLVSQTNDEELIKFLAAAREALADGIRYGGVSMRDYLDGNGHRGIMKEFLRVYDREGKVSLDGRGCVRRIVQNARSTWFVPTVQ
jgi:formamidopyrimidine-DNA glycosylase